MADDWKYPNFSRSEFACRCGCGADDIDLILVERLQAIRNALGESISIRSGCRCPKHNQAVGGVPESAHVCIPGVKKGKAADVDCPDSGFRYRFLRQAFKIFRRIEVPNGPWIHVDVDEDKPQDVCFTRS
jgi:zinc D-Ala-D-Ala carboxypeptidase